MSMRLAWMTWLVASTAACVPHPASEPEHILVLRPQQEVAGNVKVTVANDMIGFEKAAYLCDIRVASGGPMGPNLLSKGGTFTSGVSVDVGLRPGAYRFEATTCAGETRGAGATIEGPTTVHFGYGAPAAAPTPGAHIYVQFNMQDWVAHPPPPSECVPNGEWTMDLSAHCCDPEGRTHFSRSANHQVCGP